MSRSTRRKILPLDVLGERLRAARERGRRIVLCHGCFDPLHIGHIRHFELARQEGDLLVVTVTSDRHVAKGPDRPIFSETLRAEAVAALEVVDLVGINIWPTAERTLCLLRPHVYAKGAEFEAAGSDPSGRIDLERAAAATAGAKMCYTSGLTFSATELLESLGAAHRA